MILTCLAKCFLNFAQILLWFEMGQRVAAIRDNVQSDRDQADDNLFSTSLNRLQFYVPYLPKKCLGEVEREPINIVFLVNKPEIQGSRITGGPQGGGTDKKFLEPPFQKLLRRCITDGCKIELFQVLKTEN